MNHHLADLGWVDFDLNLAQLLRPFCQTLSAKGKLGRQWNSQNQSQQAQVREVMAHPVISRKYDKEQQSVRVRWV